MTAGLKVSETVVFVPSLSSWNHCSQKVSSLSLHSPQLNSGLKPKWHCNIKTIYFNNMSNSSCQRGYFLQPANIMTFFVELKGRFPMYFLEELWHFLYLHILYISVQHFTLCSKSNTKLNVFFSL